MNQTRELITFHINWIISSTVVIEEIVNVEEE